MNESDRGGLCQFPELLPIAPDGREPDGRMRFRARFGGHEVAWTWSIAEVRAAMRALDAIAEPADLTAGPGCVFTKLDALRYAANAGKADPIAVVGDGCVLVGWAGDLCSGATWWEASAKAGLFGSAIAARFPGAPVVSISPTMVGPDAPR